MSVRKWVVDYQFVRGSYYNNNLGRIDESETQLGNRLLCSECFHVNVFLTFLLPDRQNVLNRQLHGVGEEHRTSNAPSPSCPSGGATRAFDAIWHPWDESCGHEPHRLACFRLIGAVQSDFAKSRHRQDQIVRRAAVARLAARA